MDRAITLNEQQMNLLRQFTAAEQQLAMAKAHMDTVPDEDIVEASSSLNDAFNNRDRAACVFASSVAAAVGSEVANG